MAQFNSQEAPVKKKTLYLIRHGQTSSNINGRVQGWDEPLTSLGYAEARALGKRLYLHRDAYPIEVIYTSTMARAQETAAMVHAVRTRPLARKMAGVEIKKILGPIKPIPLIESKHLHERLHPSRIHGLLTSDPVAESALEEMRANFHNPNFDYGDGETYAQLIKRVDLALLEIFADPREHIAIVSHGLFLNAFVNRALHGEHLTSQIMQRSLIRFSNAGISIMKYEQGLTSSGQNWRWSFEGSDNSHTFGVE